MKNSVNKRALALLLAATMVFEGITPMKAYAKEGQENAQKEQESAALEEINAGEEKLPEENAAAQEKALDAAGESALPEEGIASLTMTNNSIETAAEMKVNEQYDVTLETGEKAYYKFAPEAGGTYRFYSTGENDTKGTLLDSEGNELSNDDDGGENNNFSITYQLEIGKTYYLQVSGYSGAIACKVAVQKEVLTLSYNSSPIVQYGEEAVLSVKAESDAGVVSYQWYQYDGDEDEYYSIKNAVSDSYTIRTDENTALYYKCVVTDGTSTKEAYIKLNIIEIAAEMKEREKYEAVTEAGEYVYYKFSPETSGEYIFYSADACSELRAELLDSAGEGVASASSGEDDWNFRMSCKLEAGKVYYLQAKGDGDSGESTGFTVAVQRDSLTISYDSNTKEVWYGEEVTLSVNASSDAGEISYQWYRYDENEYEYNTIANAVSDNYTFRADENTGSYKCVVTEGAVTKEAYFDINVKEVSLELEYEEDVTVKYGEMLNLSVNVKNAEGLPLAYKWYGYSSDKEEYIEIEGAETGIYSVLADENVSNRYKCEVSGGGSTETAYFYVTVDSGLTVVAQRYYYGRVGDNIGLSVKSESKVQNLTYEWYYYDKNTDEKILIKEAKGAEYQLLVTENSANTYYCTVSDGIQADTVSMSLEVGNADEKEINHIELAVKQAEYKWYDTPPSYVSMGIGGGIHGFIKVIYKDGTEEWVSNGYKQWTERSKNQPEGQKSGLYTTYIQYKGSLTFFETYVIVISEIGTELQFGEEIVGSVGNQTEDYQFYHVTLPENVDCAIRFSGIEGKGKCLWTYPSGGYFNIEGSGVKKIYRYGGMGKDYYFAVSSMDAERFSYHLTVDALDNLREELIPEQGGSMSSSGYYKYTPEKNGMYEIKLKDKSSGGIIYDESGERLYQLSEEENSSFYLKAGKTYYFNVATGITLSRKGDANYAENLEAVGSYKDISWKLDNTGLLTVSGSGAAESGIWREMEKIHRVILEEGINSIDEMAFYACKNLNEVTISDGLTEIGRDAFSDCHSLKKVEFPDTVTRIGEYAFSGTVLDEVNFPKNLEEIGNHAFMGCSIKELTIPVSLQRIEHEAFLWCSSLENITFSGKNNLTYVGLDAFSGTAWMEKQTGDFQELNSILLNYQGSVPKPMIPDSIRSIGVYSFLEKADITEMTIPKSVSDVAYCAFESCTALENIVLEDGVKSIGESAFINCGNVKSITIPKSVTKIEDRAFGYEYNQNTETREFDFAKTSNLPTIYCYKNSAAYQYAVENEIPYQFLDKPHDHTYETTAVKKATTTKNGTITQKCSICDEIKTTTIYYPKTITLAKTKYTYNGKAQKPSVTIKDSKGKKIASSNYAVTYSSGRKNVGTYTVTIKFKKNYTGTVKKTFTIQPKGTSLTGISAKSKGFTAKWKKQSTQTTGYEIQYSTDGKFKKGNKIQDVKKNQTTSQTIKKLKAKKKYYVRIRTYKTVKISGKSKKIYSDWSKAKTVTTKK